MESIVTEIIGEKAFVFKPPIASLFLEALTMGPIEWESNMGAKEWVSFFLNMYMFVIAVLWTKLFSRQCGMGGVWVYIYICIISEHSIFH